MSGSCGTRFVLFWFAALMPPAKSDDLEYYEIMGLNPSCSKEDVRKAYKKKSLTLHPDKILQRGGNPDDFRQEYQDIQEANEVLSDDKKRQKYNLVGKSRTRYKFLTDDGAVVGAYENLVQSSFEKKSRLVLLVAIVLGLILLQPILVCIKVNHVLSGGGLENSNWILILIPWWIMNVFYSLSLFLLVMLSSCNATMLCKFLEAGCLFAWQVVLALRWDDILTADYVLLFIPLYVALLLRWLGRYLTMREMANDVMRMTTPEILEHELGKPYSDLTEEEQEQVANDYIIVHLPPEAVLVDVDDVVQLSPEYQQAMQVYYSSFSSLVLGMLFGIPIVIMIVLKIDEVYNGSWWIVFVPVWVYLGTQLLWNCYSCCCASIVGEEVVLQMDVPEAASGDDANDEGEEKKEDGDASDSSFIDPGSSVRKFNDTMDKAEAEKHEKKEATKEPTKAAAAATATATTANDSKSAASSIDGSSDNVVEEDDAPELDPEAYEGYEEAFEQAEANAMDAQAKAGSACCALLFQITIACLIVGKLEADASGDDDEDRDDVGYNAIWILFPFILIAGCMLCIWACLIYGAGQDGLDQLVERAAGTGEDKEDGGDEESPASTPIVVPPPPPAAAAAPAAAAPAPAAEAPPAEDQTPEQFYDDGLD